MLNRSRYVVKPEPKQTKTRQSLIFFVKIVFDLMYLDPNVFLGEVMEMGENSKLWLKNLEKCLVFVWGMLCVERDFDFSDVWRKGSWRYQCVRLDWRFVPTITRRNVVVLLGRPNRMPHPCLQILISRSSSWCWWFSVFHDRYKMDCY